MALIINTDIIDILSILLIYNTDISLLILNINIVDIKWIYIIINIEYRYCWYLIQTYPYWYWILIFFISNADISSFIFHIDIVDIWHQYIIDILYRYCWYRYIINDIEYRYCWYRDIMIDHSWRTWSEKCRTPSMGFQSGKHFLANLGLISGTMFLKNFVSDSFSS